MVRLWAATWRVRRRGPELVPGEPPCVCAFWHGELLPLIALHGDHGLVGMVSQSRDGELLARALCRLGFGLIRGSSSRGGLSALRASLRALEGEQRPVAIAVDGPRGPRHQVAPGALGLTLGRGRPLVYARALCWPRLQLRSWDRFELPLPFARVELRYGRWTPPPDLGREQACAELARRLEELAHPDWEPEALALNPGCAPPER
jgi:lysophospholipid acyltransferase (LPLAT)-like uncharacterized protein